MSTKLSKAYADIDIVLVTKIGLKRLKGHALFSD